MSIVTIGGIPVYDAMILDEESGMLKISLVDDPAVMSNFQAFDSHKKMLMYEVADEEKRLVRGVVMRADFPIFRRRWENTILSTRQTPSVRWQRNTWWRIGRTMSTSCMLQTLM